MIDIPNLRTNINILQSNNHKEFDECKQMELPIEKPDVKDVDREVHAYIIQHNKKHDYYPTKCQLELVFNFNRYCPYVTCNV